MVNALKLILILLVSLILPACGSGGNSSPGGSGQDDPPPINVPGSSLGFTVNEANPTPTDIRYDYGLQTVIPAGFGQGEFTFEIWIKPDNSFQFGPTQGAGDGQLTNWSNTPVDPQPSDGGGWWYAGNFLLDGHANAGNGRGTFSLQIYGSGRVRWHFWDSAGEWGVQASNVMTAPNVVDGNWHHITLVRRWSGVTDAALELWIDGVLVATQVTSVRDNMRDYWDTWAGFLTNNEGWFWGTEKLTAIGTFDRYEDYKGLIDELRLWSRAKSATEIQNNYQDPVTGMEAGLVGLFQFSEGSANQTCNNLNTNAQVEGDCINLFNMKTGYWSTENAPLAD
jgi:hypothetical protein